MRILLSLALVLGAAAAPALAQQPATPAVDVQTLGPQVGARVPEFSLRDQHGEMRALSSLLGPNGAILVFFRSADW